MWTTSRDTLVLGLVGLTSGLAAAVTLVILLAANGQDSMAKGAAIGGGAVLLLFCVAVVRALRNPTRLTHAERTVTGHGDERDLRLTEKALATTGLVAIPATAVATVALTLGAPTVPVMAVLMWLLVVVLVVASVVGARRG